MPPSMAARHSAAHRALGGIRVRRETEAMCLTPLPDGSASSSGGMVASWGATYSRAMIEAVRDRLFHPRVVADAAAAAACAVALPVAQAAGLARGDPGDYVATAALVVLPLALRRFVPTFVALVAAAGIIATAGRLEAVDLVAFAVVSFSMADTILSRRR